MNYEAEHIRRIIQMEYHINQLFNEFLSQVVPHLKRIKYGKRSVWALNPVIEKQIDQALQNFAIKYKDYLRSYMAQEWELSEEKNDSIFMKLLKGAGIIIAADKLLKYFNRVNPTGKEVTIENILSFPRGPELMTAFIKNRLDKFISPRVWNLSGENKKIRLKTVQSGILEGRSAAKISQDLRQLLNNPDKRFRRVRDPETGKLKLSKPMAAYHPGTGVYRSSHQNALRLARTETNMAYRRADAERWQRTDFILGFEVKLSGSHVVTDICDDLKGKYPKQFTFIGWHSQCYCMAVPILPDRESFIRYLKQDSIVQGKYIQTLPGKAINYIKNNNDKLLAMKNRPYWLRDNFKVKDNKIILNI